MRRIWAATGAIAVGLAVNYLFAIWGKQSVPHLHDLTDLLASNWYWTAGAMVVLIGLSIAAERAHRKHESRAPRALRTKRGRSGDVLPPSSTTTIVGRETELARLNDWFAQVKAGTRRVVFLSGEPGIGKTTLMRTFLDSIAGQRIGRGQCVEQYGAGEPYMPVLEALTRLCREEGGNKLVEILHRLAPAWLAQMPSLVSAEDRPRLQGQAQGTTQQRMLREMAEALEVVAAETPLVLLLEDLHWSDPSTLDLIAAIARRTEPARLLILGTYRPVEMLANDHPLRATKEELELHQHCMELRLPLLSEADVAAYLEQRFAKGKESGIPRAAATRGNDRIELIENARKALPGNDKKELRGNEKGENSRESDLSFPRAGQPDRSPSEEPSQSDRAARGIPEPFAQVAPAIYARSEGNPLFMVNVVDYLVERGSLLDASTIEAPRSIRQMIERNLERLTPEDQRVLEAASVAGAEFSAAAVAAALDRPASEIEASCTRLSRREQFVSRQGSATWPDGTVAANFRFHHALYQGVLYDRLPDGHRVELHRRIADRQETAYGERAGEVAAVLANHYRRATERDKAARYFQLAGERAMDRRAYREAEQHYRDALAMLLALPESTERNNRELILQLALGEILVATRGWSAIDTAAVYARARTLAEHAPAAESLAAFYGLWTTAITRLDLRAALVLANQTLEIARGIDCPQPLVTAHYAQGLTRLALGDLITADQHFRQSIEHYREADFRGIPDDHGLNSIVWVGVNEWLLGYPDGALRYADDARARARLMNKPFALAFADGVGAWTEGFRGDFERARAASQEAERLGTELGFPVFNAYGKILGSWARAHCGELDGAADSIRAGLTELDVVKFDWDRELFLFALSETQVLARALDDAIFTVEQALKINQNQLCYRPLTLRLRGELRLKKGQAELAEQDFREAIELSRKMEAKSLELRATTSLARLLRDTDRRDEARTMLAAIYNWFTEGFDTRDLKEAKALLDELES